MTIEKFYETLQRIVDVDSELKLQSNLESINTSLTNLVAAPAQPTHQSSLATARAAFTEAVGKLNTKLTPSEMNYIADVGGADFFDPKMATEVQASIAANAMTPSVTADFVQAFVTRRAAFLKTVKETLKGLTTLGVSGFALRPGDADVSFIIPRDLFGDEVGLFAKELSLKDSCNI